LTAQAGFGTVGMIHSLANGTTIRHVLVMDVIPYIGTAKTAMNLIATAHHTLIIPATGNID
jgi:hypothetical protein